MPAFLLEVGTEELPASFLSDAIRQWRVLVPLTLQANCLQSETVEVYGTPRRLAVLITGLPSQQPDREEEIKGPPAQAAFKDGTPTPAAAGFAKKQGVELTALEIRPTDKGDFVFVSKKTPGQPVAEILTELVPQWIWGLEGKRLMRWGSGDAKFSRPIRWLVALLDGDILPIELENGAKTVRSDRTSPAHRVLHPQPVTIGHARDYVETLRSGYVIVDPKERENIIVQQVTAAAQQLGGTAKIHPDLLQEVPNLVEYPSAVVGKFAEEFLDLPTEVIITVMVNHQRYFPVFTDNYSTKLLPNFITISNGDPTKQDLISLGNERVIRARLADGSFFYKTDLAKPLADYLPQLETVTFQEDLGSVRAKVDRIVHIATKIGDQLRLEVPLREKIHRAALLCKADLVTQMVYEFPELQGIIGEKYALASGEDSEVARAIFEHYLPTGIGEIHLPTTLTGLVVNMADRLDNLVSIFGLGLVPSGSSDPFALRRAANTVIKIIWSADLPINLGNLLVEVVTDFAQAFHKDGASLTTTLADFFLQRLRTQLQEEKQVDYDLVNAVLGENDLEYRERSLENLLDVRDRALYLQQIRSNGTLDKIYETVNRSTRLAAQGDLDTKELEPQAVVNPRLFQKPSETILYNALVELVPQTQIAKQTRNYQLLVTALEKIAPAVSNFFDGADSVLIMDSNPDIKRNRLNLLGLLRNHGRVLADFGAIVKNL